MSIGNLKSKFTQTLVSATTRSFMNILTYSGLNSNKYLYFKKFQTTDLLQTINDQEGGPKIHFNHGTTTLGFKFQHGVIIAVDSRATAGDWIGELNCTRF